MTKKTVVDCATGEVQILDYTREEEEARTAQIAAADLDFSAIRQERDQKLMGSDWTQGTDAPLNAEAVAAWATYRQELRDYPAQSDKVSTMPEWPTPPP